MTNVPYFVYGADLQRGPWSRDYGMLTCSPQIDADAATTVCVALRSRNSLPTLSTDGDIVCETIGRLPMVIGVFPVRETSGRPGLRCVGVRLRDVIEERPDLSFADALEHWPVISEALRPAAMEEGPFAPASPLDGPTDPAASFASSLRDMPEARFEGLAKLLIRCASRNPGTIFEERDNTAAGVCALVARALEQAGVSNFGFSTISAGLAMRELPGDRLVMTSGLPPSEPAPSISPVVIAAVLNRLEQCQTDQTGFWALADELSRARRPRHHARPDAPSRLRFTPGLVFEFIAVWTLMFLVTMSAAILVAGLWPSRH